MMQKIYIKYNPYKIETNITIDGKAVKLNSRLNIDDNLRFQEWVEELPGILDEECNTKSKSYKIVFKGTLLDYEDLITVTNIANENGFSIECQHEKAKETEEKEQVINEIFADIQNGPFEVLKNKNLNNAFKSASSSDFEVSVVATMSAGKSTLINSFLQKKLMPAKQEACTATITKIKDREMEVFSASTYDINDDLIENIPELTDKIMKDLNENQLVSSIFVEGDIPFVSSQNMALVLIDTPGPNNSRDLNHQTATYKMLDESSKTLVIYVLNATQLAVNDDSDLLSRVADSMQVGGKQSKDRFIFVVNKLDDFKKGEDSVKASISRVKKYLEDKGIKNPNVFPATALTALDIRTKLKNVNVADLNLNDIDAELLNVCNTVKQIINNEDLHLEQYAPLTQSAKEEINKILTKAKEDKNQNTEALVHTGVLSIEKAIQMYVEKYAKTAKIKNVVDTFSKTIESTVSLENLKKEINENESIHQDILNQIIDIENKMADGEEAKKFKIEIDSINYDKEISEIAKKLNNDNQKKVSEQRQNTNEKISKEDAINKCNEFKDLSSGLLSALRWDLEKAINEHVQKNAEALLDQYISKIKSLSDDISVGIVNIDPFNLMDGDISVMKNSAEEIIKVKTEKLQVDEKRHYKEIFGFRRFLNDILGTNFHVECDIEKIYEEREYVDFSELCQICLDPIENEIYENCEKAKKYACDQVQKIKENFSEKFDELNNVLREKLKSLNEYIKDRDNLEEKIKENKNRLEWLDEIKKRIDSIIEI